MTEPSKTWYVDQLDPLPAMTETRTEVAGTFAAACALARKKFATARRPVYVRRSGTYWWYRINCDGVTNRNLNADC